VGVLLAGQLAIVAAYLTLYRFDSAGIQGWYIAGFQIPLAMLTGYAFTRLADSNRRLVNGLALGLCVWGIAGSYRVDAGIDSPLYTAGMYLHAHPELKPAGAFNAGIIAYFAEGGVTNLDGLVNDSIYPYAVSGSLADYVRERQLRTLADFHSMFEREADDPGFLNTVARRYGYSDGRLQQCLDRDADFGATAIYRVKVHCF
jgi:hypothetical protein